MKRIFQGLVAFGLLLGSISARSGEIIRSKHIIPAPAPIDEPAGFVTPNGTFNIRDKRALFYSERLANAMNLDAEGKNSRGEYLNLNHSIYTRYRLVSAKGCPKIILILMPGTWAGAMSLHQFAVDLLRLAEEAGEKGMEVWLIDRRSEQLEDHTGILWAEQNKARLSEAEILQGIQDYYRRAFEPEAEGRSLLGRVFVPLDQDSVRFMANWGADTAIRDWREVVLKAHLAVGNEVIEEDGQRVVKKKPGRWVFIGGHSLGGSLAVLYASYDFDRRPKKELLGMRDVDGLVLLEGGSFPKKMPKSSDADSYRFSLRDKYKNDKVFFDMDIMGIRYTPSTMLSLALSGWAADNVRGKETVFPQYVRPKSVQLPHITNEALLAFAIDDDLAPFFIARASIGYPKGELDKQFRKKRGLPGDPGKCPLITPMKFGQRPMDPDFVYDWNNIDLWQKSFFFGNKRYDRCTIDENKNPEVTDFYAFARSTYGGVAYYDEAPELSSGLNDFAEWYFPPRLSTDSSRVGSKIIERDGTELFNGTHIQEIDLSVISFFGDHSMGAYFVPELTEKHFPKGVLKHKATQVHLIWGYTHLDITAATRNNQPDLIPRYENYNAPAVYTYRFISSLTSGQ